MISKFVKAIARFFRQRDHEAGGPSRMVTFEANAHGDRDRDVLRGYMFMATLHISTPLWILEHHGDVFEGPAYKVPKYGNEAQGCWTPKPRLLGDLGFLEDMPPVHASDIGEVEENQYLPFLMGFRQIVEGPGTVDDKLALLEAYAGESDRNAKFWHKLKARYEGFPASFFYDHLTALPGVGNKTARNLFESGIRSIHHVRAASDEALLSVHGIGVSTLSRIRNSLSQGGPEFGCWHFVPPSEV